MTTTYNNDPAFKERVVATAKRHREADRYRQGTYLANDEDPDDVPQGWSGCAVGCTVVSLMAAERGVSDQEMADEVKGMKRTQASSVPGWQAGPLGWWSAAGWWWTQMGEYLGIPESLAQLVDFIFEALDANDNTDWPVDFLEALPVGVNVQEWEIRKFHDIVHEVTDGAENYALGAEAVLNYLRALKPARRRAPATLRP